MKDIFLEAIAKDKKLNKEFYRRFVQIAEQLDETLIPPLTGTQVITTLNTQGFWSGVVYRIYWDVVAGFTAEKKNYGS